MIWALVQYQDVIQTLADRLAASACSATSCSQAFKLDKEPRERMFAILFLIALNPLFWGLFEQAGGSMNLFTDRFVDRAGRAGVDLPVDQPDLHHPAGAVVRRAVGRRSAGAGSSPRRRPSSASRCCRWASPTSSSCGARRRSGIAAMTPVHLRVPLLPVRHHRRTVPVAGRPQRDEPAGAELHGVADHGRLVLHDRGRQFRRRQDRRGDRRA